MKISQKENYVYLTGVSTRRNMVPTINIKWRKISYLGLEIENNPGEPIGLQTEIWGSPNQFAGARLQYLQFVYEQSHIYYEPGVVVSCIIYDFWELSWFMGQNWWSPVELGGARSFQAFHFRSVIQVLVISIKLTYQPAPMVS